MEFFFIRNKHPSIKKEYEWVNNFSCSMSFFHGASSSCGDIIAYLCEQVKILEKLQNLLTFSDISQNKQITFTGFSVSSLRVVNRC